MCRNSSRQQTGMANTIFGSFWSEEFWLPPNITWQDVGPERSDGLHYRNITHLLIPIPLSFLLLGVRFYLSRRWFPIFGSWIGAKPVEVPKPAPNAALEKAYKKNKLNATQIQGLAKQADLTTSEVQRWLRLRKLQDKPSKFDKFCQSAYQGLYFFVITSFGLLLVWDKPWFRDIEKCWENYPYHPISYGVWGYYMLILANFWSLCISHLFFDYKRPDGIVYFTHHIVGVLVFCFTWISNFHRMTLCIAVALESSTLFVEPAKIARYGEFKKTSVILFGIFTVMWIALRMIIYPFWLMNSVFVDTAKHFQHFPALYVFNGLITIIMMFNTFWTFMLLKLAYNVITSPQLPRDIRSDSSENED